MADVDISPPKDWRFFNVICIGVAFMLMFTAFQTTSMVQESVLESAKISTNGTFQGSGYTSLAVIYSVFATANWAAPSIVAVCGPKWSMFGGGLAYCLFIGQFLYPLTWGLYVGSVLVGFGAAVIWTAQGNFLTINSDNDTVGRNSGIFWAMLQCSLLFGNLFVYFEFKGDVTITDDMRNTLFLVLTVTCGAGVLMLLPLRKPPQQDLLIQGDEENMDGPINAFRNSVKLLCTKNMLLLAVCFAYTGFELTFFSGVYGTCVGHTLHFGSKAKAMIGLCGICIGLGEIIGGASFGLFGKRTNKYGRDPIILLGFIIHVGCFYLIYISLPEDSPIRDSDGYTFITPRNYVVYSCAFMLGLGDSCYNTQIYSILGSLYSENSAPAFALYKFVQSLSAAAGFFYSPHIFLQWQLLILVVFAVIGTLSFFVVEWRTTKSPEVEGYGKIE